MAKQKAQTYQQKLGFFDEDLLKPSHDNIIKWVANNINIICNNLFGTTYNSNANRVIELKKLFVDLKAKKSASLRSQIKNLNSSEGSLIGFEKIHTPIKGFSLSNAKLSESIPESPSEEKLPDLEDKLLKLESLLAILEKNELADILPARSDARIVDVKWETPIISQTKNNRTGYESPKNIIGYADLKVLIDLPRLTLKGINWDKKEIESEVSWDQTYGAYDETYYTPNRYTLFIEVKTEIKSLGELFRQLNTYKEYVERNSIFLIVCPDDSEKGTIESQGFHFFKVPKIIQ